jgi:hypothetical protein
VLITQSVADVFPQSVGASQTVDPELHVGSQPVGLFGFVEVHGFDTVPPLVPHVPGLKETVIALAEPFVVVAPE